MSLESAILDHAEALRSLAHAVNKLGSPLLTVGPTDVKIDLPAETKPAVTKTKPAATTTTKTKEEKPAGSAPSGDVSYDDVRAAILALSKDKGKETVIALLQRYGAAKGPDILPAAFGKFLSDCERIQAGTYDPIAGEQEAEDELA